jgi:Diacylglycerol acyltransferase
LELSHRQGFVKLALKYGCPLVPVFVFGEKWYYNRLIFPDAVRKWVLSVLKIPLLIFWCVSGACTFVFESEVSRTTVCPYVCDMNTGAALVR